MNWKELQDPENRENKNAGNGGDLVKHTVYLTVLDYLLERAPWCDQLRVRECHAGRGMYEIWDEDKRRPLLECLYEPVDAEQGIPLHDAQRASQRALEVWPSRPADLRWYSGSAVLNAWRLGHAESGRHQLELYEFSPETRAVLRALFEQPALSYPILETRILPEPGNEREFDGEEYVETSVARWNAQDLVLLDPFAMWRTPKDQPQRDRYRRILDQVIARGDESPSLILFWTWGRAFLVADGDLAGFGEPVANGYWELRDLLHRAGKHFVRVAWRWELQFAMWILVPESHLRDLCISLRQHCDELRDQVVSNGWRSKNPNVEVVID